MQVGGGFGEIRGHRPLACCLTQGRLGPPWVSPCGRDVDEGSGLRTRADRQRGRLLMGAGKGAPFSGESSMLGGA